MQSGSAEIPTGMRRALSPVVEASARWARQDSNLDLTNYEFAALTD